ncbi:MAG: phosphate ABC transporter permease PstA [Chloroflexi bacterium]|nr:phosphate ABC transporter permease PstA [Chloroflexota bacterium]
MTTVIHTVGQTRNTSGQVKSCSTSLAHVTSSQYLRDKSNLKSRKLTQQSAFALMWLAGSVAVAVLVAIVGYVVWLGAKVITPDFILQPPRGGMAGDGGISYTLLTTFYLVVLTVGIATPLGVAAATYLVEYAGAIRKHRRLWSRLIGIARLGVETLAGVPSIIFGLFGYALFVSALHFGFSLLSATLAGACLILPVIIRTTEEALRAVPNSYREGGLALGATKWQTIWGIVLPTAAPGIITSIVLSVGRVLGETAVFYVTLGGSYRMPTSIMSSGRTLALHVFYLATETHAFDKAMGTAAILVLAIILINLVINLLARRLNRMMKG